MMTKIQKYAQKKECKINSHSFLKQIKFLISLQQLQVQHRA